ncbi:amidohydrolase [Nocardioides currus]|uniref:Amidohydrolase n=1 Tax=Nocardioides currus TaxID=2133958 RepID=A0A2R7Z139_9ACTN|nr:amidohydrolase [Nocardioides currus]PUA81859.1 amidohydrolase [Nocardioides currus]
MSSSADPTTTLIADVIEKYADELIDLRRDLHAHPELAWTESRTSTKVLEALVDTDWKLTPVEGGGIIGELGTGERRIALRADLDALPVEDLTLDPWSSTVAGVAHACGHDVHTAGLVGAALALDQVHASGQLPGRVRLLFQPAEEIMPGGALHLIQAGALDDVHQVFGLHCDPSLDVGQIGLREGPLTGAADSLFVRLGGKGGHTSRPHLTEDLTFALGKLITELPAILSRRLDPRAGVSLVWGMVQAGAAANVIPGRGQLAGTVRMLDAVAWADAEHIVRTLVGQIVAPYGVSAEVTYQRGVPPVVNDPDATAVLGGAVERVLGDHGHVATAQSLGGEDFGWYLDRIPGSMARLGTRTPGGATYDLHQGNLRVDERATAIGARVLAGAAVAALSA